MNRFWARLLATTIAVAATGGPGRADQPFEAIRTLQQLQDQIADGNAIAQAAHAKAIGHTARIFRSANLTAWQDQRNARALVVYLFSGGNAAAIAEIVPETAVAPAYRQLFDGALAYGLGQDEKARAALMPIEAKSLPSSLGGHLALVQATLAAEGDSARAIALLDLARLLEPGTLIEEAALRKEMSLIGATGDIDKFGFLARRYLSAFSRSVFADNFRQLVATAALEIGSDNSEEAVKRLSHLATNIERADRRRLYLAIAREAVLTGRTRMAMWAAQEASRLAAPSSPEAARAMVYSGAASIVGDRYDQGLRALRDVSPSQLGARDQLLRASALTVAETIRRPAVRTDIKGPDGGQSLVAGGERSLAVADQLLKEASR